MITNSLFLDVSRKEIKSITVCQGDQNSRTWNVYFSNGGTQLDLKTITSVSIYMRKPDGNFIYNPCAIDLDNNCAVLNFDEQMCLVSGTGTLQMSMYTYDEINDSLEVLYTFAIKVIISESSIPIKDITSSSEFNKLNELIQKAENNYADVIEKVTESEQNAKQSELNAKVSEDNSDIYSKMAKSYTVGDTGFREGEDTDNAKYYYEETKKNAESALNNKTDIDTKYDEIKQYKEDAATSASNASQSELNAKQSEDNASISENNSSQSESNARQSELNAKQSETNSKSSETNSKSYMDKAKEYMDNSESYMNDAKVSKDKAKTSEDNAKISEANSEEYSKLSKSYAIGGDGSVRDNEDVDNAKYYAEYAKNVKDQIDNKLKLTEFNVNDEGELIYNDTSSTLWNIDDDGNLNWEVN